MVNALFPFNDVKRELHTLGTDLESSIKRVLFSGRYILGPEVDAFEEEFALYCGAKFSIGVNSGTDALRLTLQALGVGNGDEVITVANTAVPTVAAIVATGAKPVFGDIEPDTYTIDVDHAEQVISKATRAVVCVHLYGHPVRLQELLDLCEHYGLALVEDCAQAHGAEYQGRKVGTFGVAGCFSFYPSKNLGGCGDGGMVITEDVVLADKVRALRNYGQTQRDVNEFPGHNSRLQELQAAILRLKLPHLDEWNERRRALVKVYERELRDYSGLALPTQREGSKHVYHLYVVAAPRREDLRTSLAQAGIPTMVHYPKPVYQQPGYRSLAPPVPGLPVTEEATNHILSLPLFPFMTTLEQEQVVDAIKRFFHPSG